MKTLPPPNAWLPLTEMARAMYGANNFNARLAILRGRNTGVILCANNNDRAGLVLASQDKKMEVLVRLADGYTFESARVMLGLLAP